MIPETLTETELKSLSSFENRDGQPTISQRIRKVEDTVSNHSRRIQKLEKVSELLMENYPHLDDRTTRIENQLAYENSKKIRIKT